MNEIEWQKEARRIAIALDVPSVALSEAAQTRPNLLLNGNPYSIGVNTEGYEVGVWFHEQSSTWTFHITRGGDNRLACFGCPQFPTITRKGNHAPMQSLLMRVMFRLGFDISPVETQLGVQVAAHEKLEWQLEFQRRLREENLRVEGT